MPGHLVVYLAAAPGAGKTRKLDEDARHLREHGKRVSVGVPPGDLARASDAFDAAVLDGLEHHWREALALRAAGMLVFGAFDVGRLDGVVPLSFLREADEVVAIDASPKMLRVRNPDISEADLLERRRTMLRIIDDLTTPAVAKERVNIAAAIVPHDLTEPDAYLRRCEAIVAALDLDLDVVDVAAPAEIDDLRASFVAVPIGPLAAKIVNRPVTRDVFVVSREQTYLSDPPLSPHSLGTTVGDRMRTGYGKLTIYLGAGPGTGKTIAMLDRGRQMAAEGRDVVVAGVDARGRARTTEAVGGMERLPEFDRDAIVARKPATVLIDDLLGRHRDAIAIMRAGIDVVATLDVQNVAALGDAVHRLTGAQPEVTLPDGVLALAHEMLLVDATPEAMRERGFSVESETFQGLRELAVREVLLAGDRKDSAAPFDRLLLAVAARDEDLSLIRRCSKIAARLHTGFVVACASAPGKGDASATERLRAEARAHGGSWLRIEGEDVALALLAKAREVPETTMAVGGTLRSPRWPQPNSFARRLLDAGARELFVLARRP